MKLVFRGVCGIVLFCGVDCFAVSEFFVFAPDQKQKQVMQVKVRASSDAVTIEAGEPHGLPFTPSGLALNVQRKQLIVSSGSKANLQAATLQVEAGGQLRLLGSAELKQPTGYTSVDRTGRYFLTVNYRSGEINVYRIKQNGVIGDDVCSLKSPNTEAHCLLTTPDNRFTYVPCVKKHNALFQFAFDDQTGQLTALEPQNAEPPAMFGPRHVAYHPGLPIAYFSNEQQLGVSVYEIAKDGQLDARQHAVTMARRSPYVSGKRGRHASDLVVSPDGKRLYVAVRDFVGDEDSVFTFRIEDDGRMSQIAQTKVGDVPWKLDLSPDGRFLLVSESADQKLAVFRIESDGELKRAAEINWGLSVRDMVVGR